MTGALLLAGYATAAGLGGPALLRGWPVYALRLGIVAWLALPASCVAAAILAALAVAAPSSLTWSGGMTGPDFATPGGLAAAVAGLLLAAAIVVRAAWCLAGAVSRGRRERHAHAAFLAAAGRADRTLGAVVLDQDVPAAYCLPGGPGPVVSTGTLAVLEPGQLRAVLAHERAHLRGHHHAMLTWAAALGRAFGFVPLLARAAGELAVLAEMAADDAAARRHPAEDLAAALVIMAKAGAQATALTAGGPAAVARIERLLAPPERPARVAAAAAALIPPALIACLLLLVAACDVTPHR